MYAEEFRNEMSWHLQLTFNWVSKSKYAYTYMKIEYMKQIRSTFIIVGSECYVYALY